MVNRQSVQLAPPRSLQQNIILSQQSDNSMLQSDEQHGVALKAAKDKWNELGPLRLDDIMANSQIQIDQQLPFGQSKANKFIIG
jgi:hypothetical protein